jgi:cytochrome P450
LLFAVLRHVRPIAVIGNVVFVSKAGDVREVLGRFEDFTLAQVLGPKIPWGPILLSLDWREQHARERQLLQSVVFPPDVSLIRKTVADRCRDLIARKQVDGEMDVVTDLCDDVIIEVLNGYFGIPVIGKREEMTLILGDVAGFILVEPPADSDRWFRAYANMAKLTDSVLERIRSQRIKFAEAPSDPAQADDVLTRLVKRFCAGHNPSWFDEDWIRSGLTGLAATGGGTVVRATTQAFDQLIAHPAGLQKAREIAAQLEAKFEEGAWKRFHQIVYEALRFRPMLPLLGRYCPRETIVAKGTARARTVPAGGTVIAAPIAAMFDPEVFEGPSRFSSDRPLDGYIHFGFGPRTCFGKYVADVVIVEMIRALVLLPNLKRAAGSKGRVHYDGPVASSLRITFDREHAGTEAKTGGTLA